MGRTGGRFVAFFLCPQALERKRADPSTFQLCPFRMNTRKSSRLNNRKG